MFSMFSDLVFAPIKEVIPSVETKGLELTDAARGMMEHLPDNNTSKTYTIIHFISSLSNPQPADRVYETHVVSRRFWFDTGTEKVATGNAEIALFYLACGVCIDKFNLAISKPVEDKRFGEYLEESCRYLVAAQKLYNENSLEINENLLPVMMKGGFYHWIDVLFDYQILMNTTSIQPIFAGEFIHNMKVDVERTAEQKQRIQGIIIENLAPCVRMYKNLKSMTSRIPVHWHAQRDKLMRWVEKRTAVIRAYSICFNLDPTRLESREQRARSIVEIWTLLRAGGDITGVDKPIYDLFTAEREAYNIFTCNHEPILWNSIRSGAFFNENKLQPMSYKGDDILKQNMPLHAIIPEFKKILLGKK